MCCLTQCDERRSNGRPACGPQVGGLPLSGCIAIAWSPTGALMQTFEKPDKEKGNAHKNLKVRPAWWAQTRMRSDLQVCLEPAHVTC